MNSSLCVYFDTTYQDNALCMEIAAKQETSNSKHLEGILFEKH
jgi:hypothetical protein